MKAFIFGLGLLSATAFGDSPRHPMLVDGFAVNVTGGGDYKAVVSKDGEGHYIVATERCNHKDLTSVQVLKTAVPVADELLNDVQAIFAQKAEITVDATRKGGRLTGSWVSLDMHYTVMVAGDAPTYVHTCPSPVVSIDGAVSDILGAVLAQAQMASGAICASH